MKKNLILVPLLGVLFSFNACKEPVTSKVPTKEEDAKVTETLKILIKQENRDFYKKDLKVWSKYMAQTPDVYWICVEDGVTLRAEGWADLEKFVGEWMKENPIPEPDSLLQKDIFDDFHSVVANNLAYVRYHKKHFDAKGAEKMTIEHRTFQWIDNMWKVVGTSSAPGYNSKGSTANVFIHTTESM